jgi:hypothetical protein
MRSLLLITLLATVTPCVHAQRMASASPHFARSYHRDGHARPFFGPLAFYDPFYSDYLSSTGYPIASQPPAVVVQTPPSAEPLAERSSSPAQPLMIELRGDRYVRLSGEEMSETEMIDSTATAPRRHERPAAAAIRPAVVNESAPAVLVFRDGHREEVSDYTITDGILYTAGDPYTGGSWNRKIELSSLDLPETVKSNHSRGVSFRLPSAPNEVVVRP